MDRRKALKIAALGTVVAATSLHASEDNNKDVYKNYRPEIKNRTKNKKDANPTKGQLKHTPDIKIGPKDKNGYTLVEITLNYARTRGNYSPKHR